MTIEELAAKIEWEGGIVDAVEYGIHADDLPAETPLAIREAWQRVEDALTDENLILRWLWDQGF